MRGWGERVVVRGERQGWGPREIITQNISDGSWCSVCPKPFSDIFLEQAHPFSTKKLHSTQVSMDLYIALLATNLFDAPRVYFAGPK